MVTDVSTYSVLLIFFFFNDTATTEIYTLSLHDALPISLGAHREADDDRAFGLRRVHHCKRVRGKLGLGVCLALDRKSTRLNSSHSQISYAVFCLKKKINFNTLTLVDYILNTLYVNPKPL